MASATAPSRVWTAPTTVAGVFARLLGLASLVPSICPAVDPAPASCGSDVRQTAALTGIVVVAAALLIWLGIVYLTKPSRRIGAQTAAIILVAVVGVAGLGWTVMSAGFVL